MAQCETSADTDLEQASRVNAAYLTSHYYTAVLKRAPEKPLISRREAGVRCDYVVLR